MINLFSKLWRNILSSVTPRILEMWNIVSDYSKWLWSDIIKSRKYIYLYVTSRILEMWNILSDYCKWIILWSNIIKSWKDINSFIKVLLVLEKFK